MTSKCLSKTYDYMKRNHYSSWKESRAIPWLFSHSWEQRKVADVASFTKGSGYSKSDIKDKGVPLILYGRLYTKYETVIREVDTYAEPKDGSVYSRGGEVIVPASGETAEDISIASVVEKSGVLLGGDLNIVTPGAEMDSAFLALSISYGRTHRDLSKLAQGKSVVHIHNSDIQSVDLRVPKLCEQEKIGNYFIMLDDLITLHQRDKSSRTALGSVERKEKANAWEQRKLSEMCSNFEYGLNAAAKEFDGTNKYIRITDIDDDSRAFSTADLTSPDICLDGMTRYLLSNGDIVFARTGASVGKTYIYKENDGIVYFAGFLIRAKVTQENDAEFVFQNTLTSNYEKYIRITSQRSGQPGVNAQEYGEYEFLAPSKEEQAKIGKYLRELDDLITLHQRECKYQITEDKNVKQNQRDRPLLRLLRSVDWGV